MYKTSLLTAVLRAKPKHQWPYPTLQLHVYTQKTSLALSTMTNPIQRRSRSHIHLRLHIRLRRLCSIDPRTSQLRHFKFHDSYVGEHELVAQLESVGGAEARPALRERAKLMLPECVGGTLHRPWRLRAAENVPGSIEPLQSVFAPKRSWDVLRPPPHSKTNGLTPHSNPKIDLLSGIEIYAHKISEQ